CPHQYRRSLMRCPHAYDSCLLARDQDARPSADGSLSSKIGHLTNGAPCFFLMQPLISPKSNPRMARLPLKPHLRLLWLFGLLCGVFFTADLAQAEPTRPKFDPNDKRPMPTVSLLTMGPGDEAFFKFGHNAIRVRYPGPNRDYVYNFGTFAFDSPTLILDFLTGKFRYWLSVQGFESTVRHYAQANRSVYEQELSLAGYQARHLADVLEVNA